MLERLKGSWTRWNLVRWTYSRPGVAYDRALEDVKASLDDTASHDKVRDWISARRRELDPQMDCPAPERREMQYEWRAVSRHGYVGLWRIARSSAEMDLNGSSFTCGGCLERRAVEYGEIERVV